MITSTNHFMILVTRTDLPCHEADKRISGLNPLWHEYGRQLDTVLKVLIKTFKQLYESAVFIL